MCKKRYKELVVLRHVHPQNGPGGYRGGMHGVLQHSRPTIVSGVGRNDATQLEVEFNWAVVGTGVGSVQLGLQ
jgi:hypothetical protein